MAISVGTEVEERVQRQLDSGRFADASEVIARALDALENAEKLRLLRALIAEADAEIERGEAIPWTPTLFDELMEEALQMDPNTPLPEHLRPY